jgi:hypothetical protein
MTNKNIPITVDPLETMRYCIVAGPRSGSTWLEFILIEHLKSIKMNTTRLGEFLQPIVARNEQFTLSNNNNIVYGKQEWVTDQETFEGRLAMILTGNHSQSITMRLFPQNYFFNFVDYIDVAKKFTTCNFKFISLYRNIFARALSWAVMDQSSIIHLFNVNNIQYHTTFQGNKEKTSVEPFYVCPINFTRILLMAVRDDIVRRLISEVVEVVNVDYDNLNHDLQQIGITINPTQISPVHELPYNKLITNYDQLLDIYQKLKSTL